jgi:AraC family transcriptional regulator
MTTLAFGRTFGEVFAGPATDITATLSMHPAGVDTPPHAHASDYVCLVLAGAFREQSSRGAFEWRPGDAVIHRGGEPHQDLFGPAGARCLNLHAPEGLGVDPGGRRCDPEIRSIAHALAAEVALAPGDGGLAVDALAAELLDRLVGGQDGMRDDGAWLGRVMEAMDAAPGRPWALSEIAALAGRHPAHVARTFRRRTGVSLGAWRRRRRVTELAIRLKRGDGPLADLAQDLGYADQAHMTREFRGYARAAPGAWRRGLKA